MKEQYSEDSRGFYNTDMYEQTGLKFRPIDIHSSEVVVDNSALMAQRRLSRESSRNSFPGYRATSRRGL